MIAYIWLMLAMIRMTPQELANMSRWGILETRRRKALPLLAALVKYHVLPKRMQPRLILIVMVLV